MHQTTLEERIQRRNRAQERYDALIRPTHEAGNIGRFAALDVDSEAFEIGDDFLDVCHRLRARQPAARVVVLRIGGGPIDRIGSIPPENYR